MGKKADNWYLSPFQISHFPAVQKNKVVLAQCGARGEEGRELNPRRSTDNLELLIFPT